MFSKAASHAASPKRRRRAAGRSLFTVLTLALTCVVVSAGPAEAGTVADCTGTMDNPHYSSGAAGIIAKGRWTCTRNHAEIFYTLALYRCGSYPTRTQDWVSAHCTRMGVNTNSKSPIAAGVLYTDYAPPAPGGAKSSVAAYWVAYNDWLLDGCILLENVAWSGIVHCPATTASTKTCTAA
jgi:hypothetical protein